MVEPDETVTADAALEAVVISLGEIVVEGASRGPERIVEAPAAISVVPQEVLQNVAVTGQAPMALQSVPGVDIVQSGVNDFNVNARGFNSSLNRRVLTLQDGRDLAIAFLGSQEWNGLTQPLDDLGKVEMVRGPGSALYGANAFSGVINITTPEAREVLGSKLTIAGGELETFRADGRHAGLAGRRADRLPAQRRLQPQRHLVPLAHAARTAPRSSRSTRKRPTSRCRSRSRRIPLNGQTADPVTGEVSRRPRPAPEHLRQRPARLLPRQRLGVLGGRRRRQGGERDLRDRHRPGAGATRRSSPTPAPRSAADRFNIFGYWNSRTSLEPQFSLTSGLPLEERSDIFHFEGQNNWNFQQDRGRVVYGASYRNTKVNTSGTLMNLANDDRSDDLYSAYGQLEYRITPQVRLVGAGRFDDGDLIDAQFSPKGAIVFSPDENHSFRFSVNRAFQTPNLLRVLPPGAGGRSRARVRGRWRARSRPTTPRSGRNVPPPAIADLHHHRRSALGVLASPRQALALGNADLDVEKVTGWEVGL